MNKHNLFKKVINLLFAISCFTIIGTIIVTFLLRDSISIYNLGTASTTLGIIDFICLIIIFIKAKCK